MASSGWQGQKDIQTSKYPHMALNLNVSDVKHVGTTVTFKATVRAIVTSGNIYYNNVAISLTGGGSISKNMNPVSTGGSVDFATYSCTVTGVSASATTCNVTASLNAGSVASGSATWTLQVGASYNIPSNFTVANLIPEWNAVTGTYTVGNWGGDSWQYFTARVLETETDTPPRTENQFLNASATTQATTVTTRITNDSVKLDGGVKIYGCGKYWSDIYAMNTAGDTNSSNVMFYTAPAPVSVTYTDQTNTGSRTYPVKVTGDLVNNHTTYDTANLTRYVRYQVDGGAWQVVENNSVKTLDAVTSFNITVPAGKTAVIESYMTYHGVQSEVNVTTITNGAKPTNLYGSVNGRAKALRPVYGAYGNYFSQQGPKLSTVNSNMTVSAESIRVTNAKSTASSYIWNGFAIPGTDELIGKKVTLTAEFKTSGNFTSGARLWWLNTSGVLLSGPVAGIEVIGNSGEYSISGTIPARPSGAGNLAILLYSNIASQNQGVYTDFTKVELKPDVSNVFIFKPNGMAKQGLTGTYDETNGIVSVTGTSSDTWSDINQLVDQHLDAGVYTFGAEVTSGSIYGSNIDFRMANASGGTITTYYFPPEKAVAAMVNMAEAFKNRVYIGTISGNTYNLKMKVSLEKRYNRELDGKPNLIDISALGSGTVSGLTYTTSSEGAIRITGTATANGHIKMPFKLPSGMVGKVVSMYYDGKVTGAGNLALKNNTSNISGVETLTTTYRGRSFKVTDAVNTSITYFDFYFTSGSVVDADFKFYVKEGSLASDFTPPVQTKAHRLRKIYASVNGATKLIYTE